MLAYLEPKQRKTSFEPVCVSGFGHECGGSSSGGSSGRQQYGRVGGGFVVSIVDTGKQYT